MGTRSRIGIKDADGIRSIYCHWDGYPSHNGRILLGNYTDSAKVAALVSCGDISSLAAKIEPDPAMSHTFDNPQSGIVVAYGRDRGESGCDSITSEDESAFIELVDGHIEYGYLFKDGAWFIVNGHADEKDRAIVPLTDAICEADENGEEW